MAKNPEHPAFTEQTADVYAPPRDRDPFRPTKDEVDKYLKSHPLPKIRQNRRRAYAEQQVRASKIKHAAGKEISISGTSVSRQVIYGRMRIGGVFTYPDTTGQFQVLHLIDSISGHEIDSIESVFLNEDKDPVTFESGSSGWASGKYAGIYFMNYRLGSDDQTAIADLIAQLPDRWTADHRQCGCAHVYHRLESNADKFDGTPDISYVVKGKKCYDPRTGLTVWTDNPVLCIADLLTDQRYGFGYSPDEINWGTVGDTADVADFAVPLAGGGTEKKYTLNGAFDFADVPDVLDEMLTSCAGWLSFVGGKWKIHVGHYYTPSVELTEDDVISEISIQTKIPRRENFNAVRGTYVGNELHKWEETDFPAVHNVFYSNQDNGERVFEDIVLPFTQTPTMAQRLAKIFLEQQRQPITVDFTASLRAYQVEAGETIGLSFARFGWSNKVFHVKEAEPTIENKDGSPLFGVRLALRETASTVYEWSLGEETTSDPAPNTDLPSPYTVTTPTGLTLTSGTSELYLRADGTVMTRMKVAWTPMTDFFVSSGGHIQVEKATGGSSDWVSAAVVPGASSYVHLLDVKEGVAYDVRIRAVSAYGMSSGWATTATHTVVGKGEPPTDVTGLTAELQDYGVLIKWAAVSDLDVRTYRVRVGGADWVSATPLADVDGTSYAWRMPAVGTYAVRVKAVDTSGNESTTDATTSVMISPPPPPTGLEFHVIGPNVMLAWAPPAAPVFAIQEYELSYGDTYVGSGALGTAKTTRSTFKVDWSGVRRFWVASRDVAGNLGSAISVDVTILAPSAVNDLSSEIVDNNVLLRWTEPTTHTLPVEYYKVYKGAMFGAASLIGQFDGTFSSIFEIAKGAYVYWVVPYDTAGNAGSELGIPTTVNPPPDYLLLATQTLTPASLTLSSALADGSRVLAPVNLIETWTTHFSSRGWNTIQDQIDAGFPLYIQPAPGTASAEAIIDFGSTFGGSMINLTYLEQVIANTVTTAPTISYSANGTTWTTGPAGSKQFYATNFRYVKVRFDVTSDGTGLVALSNIQVRIDVKKQTDSGTADVDAGHTDGTTVNFNLAFADVDAITVTPQGITPLIAVVNFIDVPNPTGFKVFLYNTGGARQTGTVRWSAEGAVTVT